MSKISFNYKYESLWEYCAFPIFLTVLLFFEKSLHVSRVAKGKKNPTHFHGNSET